MYYRNMATHTDNDKLLIHYFQDNLIGATLKWYMGLDNTHISSFNDLLDEFMRQYKYSLDMNPNLTSSAPCHRRIKNHSKSILRDGVKLLLRLTL